MSMGDKPNAGLITLTGHQGRENLYDRHIEPQRLILFVSGLFEFVSVPGEGNPL
jgi:hypothetical protein